MNPCDRAHPHLAVDDMVRLIKEAPPGPWPNGWAGWDNVRDAHLRLIEEAIASTPPYPEQRYAGRGIVISVNAKPGHSSGKYLEQGYFPGAWCGVKELRRRGCTLPITFTYMGPLEWDPALTRLMQPLGVECIDLRACEARDPMRILAGWESKVYGMFHAPYEETLYLDADNIPLIDPTFLFDCSQYRYYGSVFWPDVPPYDRAEWLPECVWRNVGLAYRDEVDFETGQFLVNMRRCWREMWLTRHLNEHSEYYYKFVFGDKSTFHLAWARLGSNWAIPRQGPGGNQASLIQHDFQGRQLFQHCTRNKPTLNGFPSPGSLIPRAECEAHLAELRSLWSGRLWQHDDPTPEERAIRDGLVGRVFVYEREGLDARPMRLLDDQRIGRGLMKMEVGWDVFIDEAGPLLMISSLEGAPTAMLRPAEAGAWSGRWLDYERCPVSLTPVEASGGAA